MKQYIFTCLTVLLILGCGNKSSESTSGEAPKSMIESDTGSSDGDVTKLVINSNDLMQYDRKELRAKAGTKVELTLNHTGKMAKEAMGHNLAILKMGTNLPDFAQRAIEATDNEYIPEGDEVLVHTKLIGGGESTTITFDAPEKGTYDFLCTFPGHYALMQGKFIVE